MKKGIIVAVVVAVVVVAILGWYHLPREKSEITLTLTPNPIRVDETGTFILSATNGEDTTMVLHSLTVSTYKDGELVETVTEPATHPDIITNKVPPGKTVTILIDDRRFSAGDVGDWRFELIFHTNFGDLRTSLEFTVLPS